MYSLPIASYMDFWRTSKDQSLYIGSGLLLVGSTLVYAPADDLIDNLAQRILNQPPPSIAVMPSQPMELIPEGAEFEQVIPQEQAIPEKSTQVHTVFQIVDVEVPVATEYVESNQLAPGTNKVREEGKTGTERRVIKTTQINGEVTSEKITHQFMLDAPKKRVVIRNSQPVVVSRSEVKPEIDLSKYNVQKVMTMESTAYTYTGNPTATGLEPREGLIAVDPRVIPLGTEVYIEGYGYAVAADTGGAIKGNIIDVFFPSLQRCLNWGRRPVQVYILSGK